MEAIFAVMNTTKPVTTEPEPTKPLPVGLSAKLVEHCTGIAEVTGSNPVQT